MINDPKKQNITDIVDQLMVNTERQYTEAAHAEIYRRLIDTISSFNQKTEKTEKAMLILATAQVILAITQVFLALK